LSEKPTVAAVNESTKSAHKRIDKESEKHEEYRKAVHKRIDKIHEQYNTLGENMLKADNQSARRIDAVEYSLSNVDKMIDEFKLFGKEITGALNEIKTVVSNNTVRRSTKEEVWLFIFKLTAWCGALIAIWKLVLDA